MWGREQRIEDVLPVLHINAYLYKMHITSLCISASVILPWNFCKCWRVTKFENECLKKQHHNLQSANFSSDYIWLCCINMYIYSLSPLSKQREDCWRKYQKVILKYEKYAEKDILIHAQHEGSCHWINFIFKIRVQQTIGYMLCSE